jgi:D-serine deaminase-like pyridoxal phosphate-dependent protein
VPHASSPEPPSLQKVRAALSGRRLPLAFVDLDAFERNVDRVIDQVARLGLALRVATKSVRVVELLRRISARAEERSPSGARLFGGFMCFSVEEAEHLAGHGFDDLLVAYPAFQRCDLDRAAELAGRGVRLALMADHPETIARIGGVAAALGTEVTVVLCVDMSLEIGPLHLGVRRSPLRQPEEVVALARVAAATDGTRFGGVMGYEAQVAGLGDASPFEPLANPVKRAIRAASVVELGRRRRAIVEALLTVGLAPALVNGGGSGSLDTTTRATGVTEVTAGSAFLKPHLFDYYASPHMRALEPAAFFALEVTRIPAPGMVTCLGGGYVASGPPGVDKVPRPWQPEGLELLGAEMCGEVQTPLRGARDLRLGDLVVFRHAKGGELAERFDRYHLLQGDRVVGEVPTYRGEGRCFF